MPPAVPQATWKYTTNFLRIFLMCLSLVVSQLRFWLVLMTLYFHFHNTISFGCTTSVRELHLFGLSLVMGNCFGVVKQITPLEESLLLWRLDVTLTPLPTFGTFGLVLTLCMFWYSSNLCNKVSGIKLLDTIYWVSKRCISVHHSSVLL